MKTLKISKGADPHLTKLRKFFWSSCYMLGKAESNDSRRRWMIEVNKDRSRLYRYCNKLRGKPETRQIEPDFTTKVCGMPCGVVVTDYSPNVPMMIFGEGYGDVYPPEAESIEFYLVDRKGYRARWLENKMTDEDVNNVQAEIRRYALRNQEIDVETSL